jgi:hypothetical protein
MISSVRVLQTVGTLGSDASINNDGFLTVANADSIFCRDIKSISRQNYVAEVLQVSTIQITSVSANATYQWSIPGALNYSSGTPQPVLATVTASANPTVNTVAASLNEFLLSLGGTVNFTTTVATDTVTITARTGYPIFGTPVQVGASTSTIATGTPGVIGYGLGSQLLKQYDADSYPEMANISTTGQYTQWQIRYNDMTKKGAAQQFDNTDKTLVILVNEQATAANVADLQDATYGVLSQLALGNRATVSAVATTTAAITVTTGAIALASGSVTFASLGARSGDILVINSGTSFSTRVTTSITGITGATAGFGTNIVAQSAEACKFVSLRPLPL